jgi:hypothetical protein
MNQMLLDLANIDMHLKWGGFFFIIANIWKEDRMILMQPCSLLQQVLGGFFVVIIKAYTTSGQVFCVLTNIRLDSFLSFHK